MNLASVFLIPWVLFPSVVHKPVVQDQPDTVTYWVNSLRVPCQGVAPASCLQVQIGSFKAGEWKNFYSKIEGFEFEPGFIYKLRVLEVHLAPGQVPADASSIRYTLVEILEKKPDSRLRLNDLWILETIREKSIDRVLLSQKLKRPYLEIHLAEKRIFGHEGCNDFSGDILTADEENFAVGNLKLDTNCPDMDLPGSFIDALVEAGAYRIEGLRLVLFNSNGQELMRFHKTD